MRKSKPGSASEATPRPTSRARRVAAALGLTTAFAGLACFIHLSAQAVDPDSLARLNQPIPSLLVEDSGVAVDLKKLIQGTRSVVAFHSPSCRICREVLPSLHPVPAGIRLILVNEEQGPESASISRFPGVAHFRDSHHALARSFRAISLPIILFIDENGILRDALAGSHTPDYVQKKLKNFAVNLSN